VMTNGRPILGTRVPKGTPGWGALWKKAVAENYLSSYEAVTHASCYSYRDTFLDLDPTYTDAYGRKLLRITFDFHDNERKMSEYLTDRLAEIVQKMGPRSLEKHPRAGTYDITKYQTTHTCGGAIMGTDPKTSAVNRYQQSWDVPNLFVTGATVFPQNAGYNPTGTVGALAYWAANAIRTQYLKQPGPLVQT
jgi:gluconate 2-dehydrogenase alpha chain